MQGHMFFGCVLAGAAIATASPCLGATPFDGRWSVALRCPPSPDGARPFSWRFSSVVKDGILQANHGMPGRPAYLSLHGGIDPSGKADLVAEGVTGMAGYNVHGASAGIPYRYNVPSHFEAKTGSGYWTTTRRCDFSFIK
jgi:hypothetical protein